MGYDFSINSVFRCNSKRHQQKSSNDTLRELTYDTVSACSPPSTSSFLSTLGPVLLPEAALLRFLFLLSSL
jgi:hypothetical protein